MKYFSILEDKFRFSAWPCNILYVFFTFELFKRLGSKGSTRRRRRNRTTRPAGDLLLRKKNFAKCLLSSVHCSLARVVFFLALYVLGALYVLFFRLFVSVLLSVIWNSFLHRLRVVHHFKTSLPPPPPPKEVI